MTYRVGKMESLLEWHLWYKRMTSNWCKVGSFVHHEVGSVWWYFCYGDWGWCKKCLLPVGWSTLVVWYACAAGSGPGREVYFWNRSLAAVFSEQHNSSFPSIYLLRNTIGLEKLKVWRVKDGEAEECLWRHKELIIRFPHQISSLNRLPLTQFQV